MTQPFPFETKRHRDETAPSAVHPTDFYSLTDPVLDPDNDVAPGKRWRKTDDLATPTWFEVYIRNEANAAWILERAWVNDTFAVGEVPVADANGRLAPGAVTAAAHATHHQNGGDDEISVTGLSGVLADPQTPAAHNHAASEITSGTIDQARLGTGSGGAGTKVLYDDQTYKTPSSGGTVSGSTDKLAKFTESTAVGDSAVTENSGDLTSTKALILPASGTSIASLRAPHGSAPSSPVNGDIWTTTSGIYTRINGATVGPLLDSGVGGVTGSGSTGKIPKWSSGSAIGDSDITEGSTDLTITKALYLGAATTSVPSLRAPHGLAPSSPTNGDIWTTTAGIYVRINGVTVGPLSAGGGGVSLVRASLVQVKSSISETSTIVLDSAPTSGSWLVWMCSNWLTTTALVGGAVASNTYFWEMLYGVGGNAADGTRCFIRRVKSGESATIQLPYASGANGQNLTVFEVAGGGRPVIFDTIVDSSGDPRVLTGVVDSDTSFIVGMFANTGNSSDDPSITGSVATVTEGTRATGTTSNGSPRQINPFYCNIEKGAQTITADYSSARTTNAIAVVFPPQFDV